METVSRFFSSRSSMILPRWTMPMRRTFGPAGSLLLDGLMSVLQSPRACLEFPLLSEGCLIDGLDDLGHKAVLQLEALEVQVRSLKDVESLRLLDAAFDPGL